MRPPRFKAGDKIKYTNSDDIVRTLVLPKDTRAEPIGYKGQHTSYIYIFDDEMRVLCEVEMSFVDEQ